MIKHNLIQILEQLSDNERKLLSLKLTDLLKENTLNLTSNKGKKLVAYIKNNDFLDIDHLKTHIKGQLPDYMIPTSFWEVEKIPLLPNGKVDKNKLLKTKNNSLKVDSNKSSILKPKTEIEEKLLKIWEEVLGFSPISTDDNFFEIGGDSILSIQIVSKARKEGLNLKANQLFENQTIVELAMFTDLLNELQKAEKNNQEFEGEIHLTPIQYWFFDTHKTAPHFWNQAIELQNIEHVTSDVLKTISIQLINNHDALRLSFKRNKNDWKAYIKTSVQIESFHHFDLNFENSIVIQDKKINTVLLEIQNNIDLAKGNLFKIIFFNCNGIQSNRIIIIAHHLVIDLVSWNIITNEIFQAIKNISDNTKNDYNKNKTATINDWSNYLTKSSKKEVFENELSFWNSQAIDIKKFPTDIISDLTIYSENSIFNYRNGLDSKYTNVLIHEANESYGTKVEDLLVASVISTLCKWSDSKQILLGLERQGRNIENLGVDVSNTVGWFTNFFPIALSYNSSKDLSHHIKNIKEKLREVPNNGLGFGILKYIYKTQSMIVNSIHPKVVFNYLGNTKSLKNSKDLNYKFIESSTRDPLSERNYEIEINAQIINNNLTVNWSFTKTLYKVETAENLANAFVENLKGIINYCINQDNVTYTPSDFPEADINQDDLDNLLSQL